LPSQSEFFSQPVPDEGGRRYGKGTPLYAIGFHSEDQSLIGSDSATLGLIKSEQGPGIMYGKGGIPVFPFPVFFKKDEKRFAVELRVENDISPEKIVESLKMSGKMERIIQMRMRR
jgi:hypothetical protein